MAWALVFSLSIVLTALYKGEIKPFRNKWALILVGFCLLSFYLSPAPELKFFGINAARFWSWEPLYQGLVFLLFTAVVASMNLRRKKLDIILSVMSACGIVMSVFVLLQSFKLDQFFEHRYGTYGYMAGTLGNPVLIGPFLCLVLPILLSRGKTWFAILTGVTILVTHSDVATMGLIATIVSYFMLKNRKNFIRLGISSIIVGVIVLATYFSCPRFQEICPDNERFLTWQQSLDDLNSPVMQNSKKKYVLTGIGPGSFMFLFHAKHNTNNDNFLYAHNDIVQTAYELGVVGFFLFIMTIFSIFRSQKIFVDNMPLTRRALVSGLVGILVCANGIFILQIGTHIFYTLTVVGLLYNDTV